MENEHEVSVKLLFFAQSKDLAGTHEATIQIPQKLSYQKLLTVITENFNLQSIKNNILLAVNEEVCSSDVDLEIRQCDTIAVIPPLSGG